MMSQKMHRSFTAKCSRALASSIETVRGVTGVAINWEWGCSREAPAAAPRFRKIRM
jgi:hypothetical protein